MLVVSGCSPKSDETSSGKDEIAEYSVLYSGEITTLNYLVTSTTSEFALAANLVDSLIDFDKYGVAVPGLATEWESSPDGFSMDFKNP